jgi:hypothetical protein
MGFLWIDSSRMEELEVEALEGIKNLTTEGPSNERP